MSNITFVNYENAVKIQLEKKKKKKRFFLRMSLSCFAAVTSRDITPGPGAYDAQTGGEIGKSLKYTIRPRYPEKKPLTANVDFPPTTSSLSGRVSTIGVKCTTRSTEESVGPNFLPNPNQYFRKSVTIKNRYKDKDTADQPGPADYSPRDWENPHIPVQGARLPINFYTVPDSPGPAEYSTRSKAGSDGPKVAIRPKTSMDSSRREKNPGYEYNSHDNIGKDAPKYTMPKAHASRRKDNGVPGPGSYDPDPYMSEEVRKIHTGFHIKPSSRRINAVDPPLENVRRYPELKKKTIGLRTELHDRDIATLDAPMFMPDSSLERRSLTIGKKLPTKQNGQTPGPTDYFPENPNNRSVTGFSVKGPSARDDWLPKDLSVPGPGSYTITTERSGKNWTIGNKSRLSGTRKSRQDYSAFSSRRSVTSTKTQRDNSNQ